MKFYATVEKDGKFDYAGCDGKMVFLDGKYRSLKTCIRYGLPQVKAFHGKRVKVEYYTLNNNYYGVPNYSEIVFVKGV